MLRKVNFTPNTSADGLNIIGPKEGYSPQVGTLVSMMTWMRTVMLFHLAATANTNPITMDR
jgi:hypothetical protein